MVPLNSSAPMRLVRRTKHAGVIDVAIDDLQQDIFFKLPLNRFGRAYYRAINEKGNVDCTFALMQDNRVAAVIECDNVGGHLGRFGFPIEMRIDGRLHYTFRQKAAIEVIAEFKRLSTDLGGVATIVRAGGALDPDGLLLGFLLAEGASCRPETRAEIDLALDRDSLFADLRKGHRQQVRWGEQNLTFSSVDQRNPDRLAFESYQAFHSEVAGRVTRNSVSWDAMFDAISAGAGDLVLGYLDGLLVSGTLVLDSEVTAYYASGVYHREHFDKPLGHASLFRSVMRAKERGRSYFDVGEIPLKDAGASEKELKIGFFKRGFTSRTVSSCILTLPGRTGPEGHTA